MAATWSPSKRSSPARPPRSSPSPGGSSATSRTPATSPRWSSCGSGTSSHRYDEKYSLNTWLYRIATNLSIDFLRSSRSRERAHGATLHLVRAREESTASDATRNAEDAELVRLFETVSDRLSEKQKAAFVLKEMQDCETREIAEILNCGESTVRNHLFNARRILRKEIGRLFPEFLRGRPLA